MKILVLGGTAFLGRHIVEQALSRGHQVTLFNRGQSNPDLFPQAEHLRGDRDGNLQALEGGSWDAVIDTSGYVPRIVRASAEMLRNKVSHYTFISTLSVYKDFAQSGMTEDAPLGTLEDESVEEVTGETYGPLKVLCEQAVEEVFPGRALIIRPGLIVGPNDPTDRFTYWPVRVAEGGEVLAPDRPDKEVQVIDVRDLSAFTLDMVERKATGIYNATGPDYPLTMGSLLEKANATLGNRASFTWVPESFLLDRDVQPWMELPLWMPDVEHYQGFGSFNCSKAWQAGMKHRPMEETIRDTVAWAGTLPADRETRAGMRRDRETELLQEWRQRSE